MWKLKELITFLTLENQNAQFLLACNYLSLQDAKISLNLTDLKVLQILGI